MCIIALIRIIDENKVYIVEMWSFDPMTSSTTCRFCVAALYRRGADLDEEAVARCRRNTMYSAIGGSLPGTYLTVRSSRRRRVHGGTLVLVLGHFVSTGDCNVFSKHLYGVVLGLRLIFAACYVPGFLMI